ncbi:MAG: glycosyltransferase family 4 protein [Desulfobacteraceae bacterium]|nr:glycosyltransferase family 4 protein [Desulfobacteraceae bacterium]
MKKIAFIMSTFPTLTETFVAGEINILKDKFPQSRIYSLRPPFDSNLHEESRKLMKQTTYVASSLSSECLKTNISWLRQDPIRYLGVLSYVIFHTISNPLHMLKTLYLFPQAAHLATILSRDGIDHAHSHWAGYPTTTALIVSLLNGIPFSFTSHACDMSMIKTMMAEKVRKASFLVTCTADNIRYLSTFLPRDQLEKVNVNYHGSNLRKFRPGAGRPRTSETKVILSCADLHERKGFPYLLQALALLRNKGESFHCRIIGEGPQRPVLEKMIADLGLRDCVEMPGAVTHETLIDYYAESRMFVLPCVHQHLRFFRKNVDLDRYKILECKMSGGESIQKDGIPNVLVEAMAMKIPVVSTTIAAIPELVSDGRNGLLVPEKDPELLSAAIERLIHDDELCRRLGENGYVTVHEKFDRSKNIEDLVDIFSQSRPSREHAA